MAGVKHARTVRSGDGGACRRRAARPEPAREPDVRIELTDDEPTVEQRQAYERFWRLFLERQVRERLLDEND